ncbi:MAG TPA: sodium:solute symporter [Thermoplasmata archaeon]|nr:sodium:solute symporter [Thermoplasmata archaeon]
MVDLTFLDMIWIALFVGLMIALALLFYRLSKRSQSDFFLAGRGLPWWLPATSVYATHTGTDTPIWYSGVIYQYGLAGMWYGFFATWCSISAFASAKIFRRSLSYTQAEWQTLRFSGLGAELSRGWLSGWRAFMDIFTVGWMNAAIYMICNYLFGWPFWLSFLVFTVSVAIYVTTSGYWGVVMADFQQGIFVLIVIVLVSVIGISVAGGPAGILSSLESMGKEWMANPFAFKEFGGGLPLAWFLTMFFAAIIAGFGMGSHTDWYTEAQRIQSAKTLKDSSYCMWAGPALVIIRNALWAVAILAFFVLSPNLLPPNPANPPPLHQAAEMAWYRIGFDYLPEVSAGLLGFFIAAIIGIHFSTVSTHLNLGASYLTRDLYQHYINPEASEQRLVWGGRISTLIILAGSFFFGWMMKAEITSWLIFTMWIMMAGTWIPNILQVVWWRFNIKGWLAAWIANMGLAWIVVWILPSVNILSGLLDYQQFWILLALSALIYLPVTLLTKPEPTEHLVRFYVMARPYGWWGPIRKEAERRGLIKPIEKTKGGQK